MNKWAEDRMVEIIAEKQNKGKQMKKKIEESLRNFWGNIKCTNIQVIGIPDKEEEKKGTEKFSEEIIVDNFPNMGKEIVNQFQEVQRVPYRSNPRRNISRDILIKLTEIKHKESILKTAREKQQVAYKGKPIQLTVDLLAETLKARRKWQDIFKKLKEKKKKTNK